MKSLIENSYYDNNPESVAGVLELFIYNFHHPIEKHKKGAVVKRMDQARDPTFASRRHFVIRERRIFLRAHTSFSLVSGRYSLGEYFESKMVLANCCRVCHHKHFPRLVSDRRRSYMSISRYFVPYASSFIFMSLRSCGNHYSPLSNPSVPC